MRIVLVGSVAERRRMRLELDERHAIAGQFDSLPHARASAPASDAILMSTGRGPIERGTDALTPREHDVLELLVEGLSNKAIAAHLGISDQTVKFHVAAISGKLGAANRTEAVRRAIRQGLVAV